MADYSIPFWKQAPFLRIIIPFIAGIVLGNKFYPPIFWIWISLTVFLIGFCFLNGMKISFQWKFGWIRGLLVEALMGLLGVLVIDNQIYQTSSINLANFYNPGDWVMAELTVLPLKKNNIIYAECSCISLLAKGKIIHSNGPIVITIETKSSDKTDIIKMNDQILFNKPLEKIYSLRNPVSVDHQGHITSGTVKFRVYLRENEFRIVHLDKTTTPSSILEEAKSKILNILKNSIRGEKESGLAEALLLGFRQDLDKELLQSYVLSGVVHIIAISGLHLALIFTILKFLMRPIYKRRPGKWIAAFSIIAMLWAFSFLSGASPSVLRSALMFSLLVIAENLNKHGSVYNSLFSSAFILLCIDPSWLWDIGFQLSYLAVLSIVIFYKPVYHLINFSPRIPDLLWQSIALTLSAQILTAPICILNFHQFPVYFLPANLLAVPLSSLILIGEILLCIIAWAPGLGQALGAILTKLIWFLNSYIEQISKLPYSSWNQLEISAVQTLLMYVAIGSLGSWTLKRQKTGLFIGLLSICFFIAIRSRSMLDSFQQQKLIIYNIPRRQAVDCIRGREFSFFGDSVTEANAPVRKFYLDPARISLRLDKRINAKHFAKGPKVFTWSKKKLIILEDPWLGNSIDNSLQVDFVVLSKNCTDSITRLNKTFSNAFWIFDRSNSGKRLIQWKNECENLGLSYYDVADKGAFVMNMD